MLSFCLSLTSFSFFLTDLISQSDIGADSGKNQEITQRSDNKVREHGAAVIVNV